MRARKGKSGYRARKLNIKIFYSDFSHKFMQDSPMKIFKGSKLKYCEVKWHTWKFRPIFNIFSKFFVRNWHLSDLNHFPVSLIELIWKYILNFLLAQRKLELILGAFQIIQKSLGCFPLPPLFLEQSYKKIFLKTSPPPEAYQVWLLIKTASRKSFSIFGSVHIWS